MANQIEMFAAPKKVVYKLAKDLKVGDVVAVDYPATDVASVKYTVKSIKPLNSYSMYVKLTGFRFIQVFSKNHKFGVIS